MNEIEKAEFEKWWMTTFHGLSTDETIRYRDVGKQSAMIGWAAAIKHERDRSNDIVQAKLSCAKELAEKDKEIQELKEQEKFLVSLLDWDNMTKEESATCIQLYTKHFPQFNNGGQG